MRRLIAGVGSVGVVALVAWTPAGCSSKGEGGPGANLPLVTPPVRAATPQGLGGSAAKSLHPAAVRFRGFFLDGGLDPEASPPPPNPDASLALDGGMGGGTGSEASPGPGPCPGLGPDASPGSCPGPGSDASPGPGPGPGSDASQGGTCPGLGPDASPGSCPSPGSDASPGPGLSPEGGIGPAFGAGLDPSDIKSRFFSAGPTNIFSILSEIDGRISEINERSKGMDVPCLMQPPVGYTLTPFGQSVPFYAQCVLHLSASATKTASFIQFGQKDGMTYLYEAVGAESIGARLAPVAGSPGQYTVDAWMGVGYENAGCGNGSGFDDCSYGVMALKADSSHLNFELSVAGIGFGYCGAQLKSDATTVYLKGSADMGATCNETASLCVAAVDLAMTAMCPSTSFALPAIGRATTSGPNGTWGDSQYPGAGSDGVVLNGSPSDSLGFGPLVATPGVPEFVATSPTSNDGGDAAK